VRQAHDAEKYVVSEGAMVGSHGRLAWELSRRGADWIGRSGGVLWWVWRGRDTVLAPS
jgi:hypothetical protein